MSEDIMKNILESCQNCGYNIVAVVCDLGGTNRSFLNTLNVDEEKPWFIFNEQKIFVFADVPHLLKLLRNHFLDEGFFINGKPVKKDIILELLSCTSTDVTITHKISASHLNVSGPLRQKVKTAAKLFSHTVAQAITRAASLGHLHEHNWNECFQLFKTTNDWFDLLNVKVPYADRRKRRHAYGLALEEQDEIIRQMTDMMKTMRVIGKHSLMPFQKGSHIKWHNTNIKTQKGPFQGHHILPETTKMLQQYIKGPFQGRKTLKQRDQRFYTMKK